MQGCRVGGEARTEFRGWLATLAHPPQSEVGLNIPIRGSGSSFYTSVLGRNSGSNAGSPNYFGVCYVRLLSHDNAGVFTDVLSNLFLVFVFPHLFFT
jgi:hypothetical protein